MVETNYDLELAYCLMQLCDRSYKDGDDGLLFSAEMGQARVIVQILPGYGGALGVAFRGTIEALDDWLHDFDVDPVPFTAYSGAKFPVHAGFLDKMSLVRAQLDDFLRDRIEMVYYTGHSQGGACAPLYALTRDNVNCAGVYTFGQPRYCTIDGAAPIDTHLSNYWRTVNDNDIVPRVPSSGWEHVGKIAKLDGDGNLTFPNVQGWASIDIVQDVEEHLTDSYLQHMQNAMIHKRA